MTIASKVLGTCLGFPGVCLLSVSYLAARDSFRYAIHPIKEDNKSKQVARVVATALDYIGRYAACMAAIGMGLQMITMGPQMGFFSSVFEGAKLAAPYATQALTCLTLATLGLIYGGTPYTPPRPSHPNVTRTV